MKRFTLIELMIVMVVTIIIVGMTTAMYQKIGSGRQVDISASAVASALSRSRQMAVANRREVALLMPGPNAAIPNDKRFSAFRIAFVDRYTSGGTTGYRFNSFPAGTQWQYTQKACAIMEVDGDVGIRSYDASTGYNLELYPSHDDFTTVDDVDLSGLDGGSAEDNIRAVVFSKSGKRRGPSQYVTLGEAQFFTSRWVVVKPESGSNASRNISTTNQITLEVSRFTGSVNYIQPENYPLP